MLYFMSSIPFMRTTNPTPNHFLRIQLTFETGIGPIWVIFVAVSMVRVDTAASEKPHGTIIDSLYMPTNCLDLQLHSCMRARS